jgi:hypothetical protein
MKSKLKTKTHANMTVLEKLIPLADAHQAADEYRTGHYWEENETGCAVGCTIHDAIALGVLPKGTEHGSHESIASATGLPEMVWRLADNIFEGLPSDIRPSWTPRFLRAASRCTNPAPVPARIMARLAERLAGDATREDVKTVCLVVAGLWKRRASGNEPDEAEWDAAREQAYAAREQSSAARKQAYAARKQSSAARKQASAALERFWVWCADVVCEELAK